jgi:uncharacterized protein (TIGR03083 family)
VNAPEYLEHIRAESARFAGCLAGADPSAPVPSCPDWTAADLVWHLAEVQLFWGAIVRERLDDPDLAEAAKPERPDDYEALLGLFAKASAALVDKLAATADDVSVWTWADDHTVGFIRRRQAHEALIHRVDAELVAGQLTHVDRSLASDGVDEALPVMFGEHPAWGTLTTDGPTGSIETTDTDAAWALRLGRFSGTSPNTGKTYDEETLIVLAEPERPPSFTLRGDASDLDLWLWGRAGADPLQMVGDAGAFARLESIVKAGLD